MAVIGFKDLIIMEWNKRGGRRVFHPFKGFMIRQGQNVRSQKHTTLFSNNPTLLIMLGEFLIFKDLENLGRS